MKYLLNPTIAASAIILLSCTAHAQETRPYLSLDAAKAGAAACEAFANENDLRIAISIKDRGGRMVYFSRMDDVYQKQVEFAGIKAETAATTPLSTKRLAAIAGTKNSPLAGLIYVPGLTGVEGGETITLVDGYKIGGVGVSGASPAEDGDCARSAVEAIVKIYG